MSDRMSQTPIVVDKNGKVTQPEIKEIPSEKWLQKMLPQCPELLPTVAIDDKRYSHLTYICGEAGTTTSKRGQGHIDLLYISNTGHLVLVETKLHRNPESCREVVGQIMDYAANICTSWDYDKLNSLYGKNDLYTDIRKKYGNISDQETFIQNVNYNLRHGELLMLIVGDTIRPSVENIARFINSPIDMKYQLALCEIKTYSLGDKFLAVPRLTTSTKLIERAVITIKDDRIVSHAPATPDTTEKTDGYKYFQISEEEFVSKFVTKNPKISAEQVYDFLESLRNAGFFTHSATKQISIGISKLIALFQMSDSSIWFVPSILQSRMKGNNANAALSYFLELMRPFLIAGQSPYKDMRKFYRVDMSVITTRRTEFINALIKFKNTL